MKKTNIKQEIYVVVAENDQQHTIEGKTFFDDEGPIVFEQYVKHSDLSAIREKAKNIEKSGYGKCRIAKLCFLEEEF